MLREWRDACAHLFFNSQEITSCELKNAPLWIALRRTGIMSLCDPPQAENPADGILFMAEIRRQKGDRK
ncbi:MAG: hypothetical protein KH452_08345 [Clostridiales bacterium]|nr:hypothetical protein [Clostridiales bacterium]